MVVYHCAINNYVAVANLFYQLIHRNAVPNLRPLNPLTIFHFNSHETLVISHSYCLAKTSMCLRLINLKTNCQYFATWKFGFLFRKEKKSDEISKYIQHIFAPSAFDGG